MPDEERERDGGGDAPEAGAAPAGGWRSQPLALRILLLASITAVVAGVVKCSVEVTPAAPNVGSVATAPAVVDVPDEVPPAPADSIAR